MKQRYLLLTFMGICSSAMAQTDITSKYIKNPSFEADAIASLPADATRGAFAISKVTGWDLSGTYGVSDIMTSAATATDNNLGRPGNAADGTQMYYIRQAWSNGNAALKQTITLPAGKYRLTVDSKSATPGTNSSGKMVVTSAALMGEAESTALTMNNGSIPATWTPTSVEFTLKEEAIVTFGFEFTWVNSAGASFLLDNVRLYNITDEVVKPDPKENDVPSFTEGVITDKFVNEAEMKDDLLQMLANFSKYMVNDWYQCQAPNSKNELCGYFNGEKSGASNEQGVRPNADMSMVCAFLVKYGKPAGVTLPQGVTWEKVEQLAMQSLVFAYSTHKANKLKVCSDNRYWGSTSTSDAVWESSLWAMSVAYSAFFQWDKLTETQKGYIYAMLKAECNYELGRTIPTGYAGDTKAEENGWEADILAATLGLFPDDPLAPRWFERLREFAINSYSHTKDANDNTVVDPDYNDRTVADMYKGPNLYDDYSLQNHNLFHTSYQNVVMQELGEAALALKMFQLGTTGTEKWKTNALMHNLKEVQDSVLNWLALPDGELAMPNGNDWSLFLYDQITSYSTMACFLNDGNAAMMENMAYKYIKARQQTTSDGSWLLRPDVGARRMGVQAHRVMMTYLMHDIMPTHNYHTEWDYFQKQHSEARMLPCQNIVRASSKTRFSCFSWSNGLKSYTGYFAANNPDKNKIVVPYRANNTGNITGWYEVSGKGTNATPVVSGIYQLDGDAYVMNGEMNTNDGALNNRFAIYSTRNNAVIYLDYVTAKAACTITADKVGQLAISTDELTKRTRTLYYDAGTGTAALDDPEFNITHKQSDGSSMTTYTSPWVNIDNDLGVVNVGSKSKFAFGDRSANNSIYTSKLYPQYSNTSRQVKAGEVVDAHDIIYYSNKSCWQTREAASMTVPLRDKLPEGWNGVMANDETLAAAILVSNFKGEGTTAEVSGLQYDGMAPVFYEPTVITDSKSATTFKVQQNNSFAMNMTTFIEGTDVVAQLESESSFFVTAKADTKIKVTLVSTPLMKTTWDMEMKKGETVHVYLDHMNDVQREIVDIIDINQTDYTGQIVNPKFQGNSAAGWEGAPAVNYNSGEKFNTNFNVSQTVKDLPEGYYMLGVQGFYRAGGYAAAAASRKNGTEKMNATLYANDASCEMMSIFEDAGKKGAVGVNQAPYGYIPDNMEQASIYFRQGLYPNSVMCHVGEDGVLTFGIKKSSLIANDWCIFTNFTLTYLGKDDPTVSVNVISDEEMPAAKGIYNLQGVRLAQPPANGICIIDGKKVMIK